MTAENAAKENNIVANGFQRLKEAEVLNYD